MGRQSSEPRATTIVAALTLLSATACEARSTKDDVIARATERRASSAAPVVVAPTSSSLLPPLVVAPEGAEGPEAVFARAQAAIDARDLLALVYTIRPETRRRWTRDIAVALALESVDDGTDPDLGRREAKESARRLLSRFGATAKVGEKAELGVEAVERRLFENVRDPDGLLAAMLLFADLHGCEFDPLCALGPSGLDGIAKPEESRTPKVERAAIDAGGPASRVPSVAASGLVRLLARVRAPHRLGKVEGDGSAPVGMTEAPGFFPVRFHRSGAITWLDES